MRYILQKIGIILSFIGLLVVALLIATNHLGFAANLAQYVFALFALSVLGGLLLHAKN